MGRPWTSGEAEALVWAFEVIAKLPKKGFTLARVMKAGTLDHRTAFRLVDLLDRLGYLARSGGGPGEAFIWKRTEKEP